MSRATHRGVWDGSEGEHDGQALSVPVVRRQRRGGGQLLRDVAAGQPRRQRSGAPRRRRRPAGGHGADRRLHAGRPGFQGLNGGPDFTFNEAVSFVIDCEDQAEVDRLWDALTANGGEPGPCGWLKDRFGLSWQIVPRRLEELLNDPDPERARRAMEAMLKMGKIEVARAGARRRRGVKTREMCAFPPRDDSVTARTPHAGGRSLATVDVILSVLQDPAFAAKVLKELGIRPVLKS